MITDDIYRRTLLLKYGDSAGSGFVIEKDDKQYLITATHVLAGIKTGDTIYISYSGHWIATIPDIIGYCPNGIDISVLALSRALVKGRSVISDKTRRERNDLSGFVYGQDVYFLGFPFGLFMDVGEMNNLFPLPIVKKALLSGELAGEIRGIYLLDGINNPGFSGGPVVYRNPLVPKSNLYVMAVISGYRTHDAQVKYEGKKTPLVALENTGIIISYSIRHALDLIDANPRGAPL